MGRGRGGSEVREEEVNGLKETGENQKEGRKQGGNETMSTEYTLGYGYLTSPLKMDNLKVAYTTCRLPTSLSHTTLNNGESVSE